MSTAIQSSDMPELRDRFEEVLARLDGEAAMPGLERMTAALGQIAEIMRQDREELAACRRELQVVHTENQELKGMLARLLDRLDTPRLSSAEPFARLATAPVIEAGGAGAAAMARGNAARDAGRLAEATEAFRAATAADPLLAQAWADLALCLLATNRTDEAERAVATALGIDAAHPAALRAQVLVHLRRGDHVAADSAYQRLRAADPDAPQTSLVGGLLHLAAGSLDRALPLIDAAIAGNPNLAEAHANRAQVLLRLKRAEEAAVSARRACALRPGLASVHVLLGMIERSLGRFDAALDAFRAATSADPDAVDGHLALAETLRMARRFDEALAVLATALASHSGHAGLLCSRGTVLHEMGDADAAIATYGAAIAADPGMAEAHNNLARLLEARGRLSDAIAALEAAVRARPGDATFRRNLAAALLTAGRVEEAEAQIRTVFAVGTPSAEDWHALATVLVRRQRPAEALAAAREAVALGDGQFEVQRQLAALLQRTGRHIEALTVVRRLVRRHAGNLQAWQALAGCLEHLHGRLDLTLREEISAYLRLEGVNHQRLAGQGAQLVRQTDGFQQAFALVRTGDMAALDEAIASGRLGSLLTDPLFLIVLERCIVPEVDFESVLTALRSRCLALQQARPQTLAPYGDFLCALAAQCHATEFVYVSTDAERTAAIELRTRVEAGLAAGKIDVAQLALVACYHQLDSLRGVDALLKGRIPPEIALHRLVATHLAEPAGEKAIRETIPVLTPIRGQTSTKVRDQYETNPYPRWLTADRIQPRPLPQVMAALFPGRRFESLPAAPEILIAGCGTGQEAVAVAQRFAGARVLAVDLSLRSLSHAIRKAREMKLDNIEFGQADLLDLGGLGRQFDIVESVGVLHHTDDTFASWRSLMPLVRPGGLMRIGLFSAIARKLIAEARQTLGRQFPILTDDVIRTCRQRIRGMGTANPLHRIRESHDFYTMSACRDLLFHVRETHHGLDEIADWVKRLDLEFLGFEFADPAIPEAYRAAGGDPADLTAWADFERRNPASFLSMYQFWVRRR